MRIFNRWRVEAKADKVWDVVGEQFGEIGEMLSGLESTRLDGDLGVGTARVCTTNGFGPFPALTIEERLVAFDRSNYTLTYIADQGLPVIFISAQNTWNIKPISADACEITANAIIELKWWAKPLGLLLPALMAKDFGIVGEELKYRIEEGRSHPRKQRKVSKLSYSNG